MQHNTITDLPYSLFEDRTQPKKEIFHEYQLILFYWPYSGEINLQWSSLEPLCPLLLPPTTLELTSFLLRLFCYLTSPRDLHPGFLPTRARGSIPSGSTTPSRQPTFVTEFILQHSKSKPVFPMKNELTKRFLQQGKLSASFQVSFPSKE